MSTSSMIVLLGISGSGKSTLCEAALIKYPFIKKLIAVTTRPSRKYELDRVDKYFISQKEFDIQVEAQSLCLVYEAYGYHYAFHKKDFFTGDTYISELNYKNLGDFTNYCPHLTSIYVKPREPELALSGIKNRGSDSDEVKNRTERIYDEILELENLFAEGKINHVFMNNYEDDSKHRFELLLETILLYQL